MSERKTEGAKWREFLTPIVGALIILFQACTTYFQNGKNDNTEERLARIETSNTYLENSQQVLKGDFDRANYNLKRDFENMNKAIFTIQKDVAFIRGKLEK